MERMSSIACVAPLFVPGDRPERFSKASASGADAIIIDLEDAVAPQNKIMAREALAIDLPTLSVFVRINAVGTPWHEDDIAAVRALPIAGIILPKAELGDDFLRLAGSSLPLLPLVETAKGLADARAIAATPGVARLIFGSIDCCADLGMAHNRECLLPARWELVLASRLANILPPIDGVTVTLDDAGLIERDASYARSLGFTGKLAVHPRQVHPILGSFRPTIVEVDWANRVLASGDGAASVDNAMVDEPVRIRARRILSYGQSTA